MLSASDFGDIKRIPADPDEVIWSDLDSHFHDDCVHSLNELTDSCKAGNGSRTSFYVGAGISIFRPSKLPDARTVLKTLFDYCKQSYSPTYDAEVDTLLEVIDQGGYVLMENVFQQLYENIRPQTFHSGNIFDVPNTAQRFNVNHLFLARWLQSGTGTVITTNLDPLIEQAWLAISPPNNHLHVIKHPADFDDWRAVINNRNVVWKPHGSADDPETWAITLSKVGFKLEDSRAHFIEHVVTDHHVCFLGYRAADLDLFPSILTAQTHKHSSSPKIFWVFYFRDGYRTSHGGKRTLEDYLAHEPNIRKLFEANPSGFKPIVTTAERLLMWLRSQCWGEIANIPDIQAPVSNYDFSEGLKLDIDAVGFIGTGKLIGFTLRTVGKHEEALNALDGVAAVVDQSSQSLDNQTRIQMAQLWQESAHTFFQQGRAREALEKLDRAWKLLESSEDQLGRAWCQYGRVTMALDSPGISMFLRLQALQRLIVLKRWFARLAENNADSSSPLLGQGLCLYYQLKFVERIGSISGLLHLKFTRGLLLNGYGTVEHILRKTEYVSSLPDVLRRKAFLLAPMSPSEAVRQMMESIRVAEVVSHEHHVLACSRARLLLKQIREPSAQKILQAFIDQSCPSG